MPEAFAVFFVFVVSLGIYLFAKLQARSPEFRKPEVKLAQLQEQRAWLEERLQQAEREKWSPEMRKPIAEQLEETRRKLSQMGASYPE